MTFEGSLWQEFAAESEEHLDALEHRLGAGPVPDRPGIDALFRAFHSLKGMSDALGATGMMRLAHRCEDLLGAARAQRVSVAGPVLDALLLAVDALRALRAEMLDHRRDSPPDAGLLARLGRLAEGTVPADPPATADAPASASDALLAALASRFADAAPLLARLARGPDAEAAAEARDLSEAARLLRQSRLSDTIATLGTGRSEAALPLLGRLRRQLRVLAQRCGEDAGAAALGTASAEMAGETLLRRLPLLSEQLDAAITGDEQVAAPLAAAAREAAAIAAAGGLDGLEATLLRIEDLAERAAEPEAAARLAEHGPALAARLRAALSRGLAAASAEENWEPDAAPILPPHVPPVFGPVLGVEGSRLLEEALRDGTPLYRARIAIGASAEQEARLETWLREETQPITSRTVLHGTSPYLDMLLAASTPLPELMRRAERIDPAHHLMLALEPLADQAEAPQRAGPVTMRVRQEVVDGIIALEAEVRAAAFAMNEAINDQDVQQLLNALGRIERRLSGEAARELRGAIEALRRSQEQMALAESRLTLSLRQLDDAVLDLRIVPVDNLFGRLPRVVRAVAEAAGKDVELILEGRDVRIDRGLVDMLADPLLHLVRNAVDHGIETPAQRKAAGKPARATLRIAAQRQPTQIVLTVSDDGRGIDRAAVLARAVQRGLLPAERAEGLGEAEVQALLFTPGFSTMKTVTATSGRGVGLDVVRDVARRGGGALDLDSQPGRGTTFRLMLPVTAAMQAVLLVEVGGHPYALPAARVESVLDATTSPGCATVSLAPLLGLSPDAEAPGGTVVVRSAGRSLGIRVDRVRRHTNLLLRPMHPGLAGLPAVAGLGVLGNGDPVVVLEPDALVLN